MAESKNLALGTGSVSLEIRIIASEKLKIERLKSLIDESAVSLAKTIEHEEGIFSYDIYSVEARVRGSARTTNHASIRLLEPG